MTRPDGQPGHAPANRQIPDAEALDRPACVTTPSRAAGPGYASTWEVYLEAGWSPLPLPTGEKWPPPSGFTGANGARPDRRQCEQWARSLPGGNFALRLPDNVIGIDVDAYDNKQGGRTLAVLEQELGPLPATWWATSRSDGRSGIRLFQVPIGQQWKSELKATQADGSLTKDIDVIHSGYRYVVAWPSMHPEGRGYRWLDQPGHDSASPPHPSSLPELPPAWVDFVSARRVKKRQQVTMGTKAQDKAAQAAQGKAAQGKAAHRARQRRARQRRARQRRARQRRTRRGWMTW